MIEKCFYCDRPTSDNKKFLGEIICEYCRKLIALTVKNYIKEVNEKK